MRPLPLEISQPVLTGGTLQTGITGTMDSQAQSQTVVNAAAPRASYPLTRRELRRIDSCWRAANLLCVGQIRLLDNPLCEESIEVYVEDVPEIRNRKWPC